LEKLEYILFYSSDISDFKETNKNIFKIFLEINIMSKNPFKKKKR